MFFFHLLFIIYPLVVTFKRFHDTTSPTSERTDATVVSRKRKKPGGGTYRKALLLCALILVFVHVKLKILPQA